MKENRIKTGEESDEYLMKVELFELHEIQRTFNNQNGTYILYLSCCILFSLISFYYFVKNGISLKGFFSFLSLIFFTSGFFLFRKRRKFEKSYIEKLQSDFEAKVDKL